MLIQDETEICPCGSKLLFSQCCGPYLSGTEPAPSAEALMRSRYTAFALGAVDYLIDTLAPEKRSDKDHSLLSEEIRATQWRRLEIVGSSKGQPGDTAGEVEFKAWFRAPEVSGHLHERSNFRFEAGHWFYVDGDVRFIEDEESTE